MDKISVGIRIRPLNEREVSQNCVAAWQWDSSSIVQLSPLTGKPIPSAKYTFGIIALKSYIYLTLYEDHIFDNATTTPQIYESLAKDITLSAMSGINGTAKLLIDSNLCKELFLLTVKPLLGKLIP
jgi:hypothetical protein